ncbi:hypothetical protein DPMN_087142 [Dreissena polymorpha]|uniref:Histone-lysine N-methyltransferase SETMAR n=1 Tax=Dreissena polymorpha TaxID=45954 RepID=A0A9D4QV77_DREPO|nr:hypothetical protein DPMN_087142 [Dreissena polymorpha]
MQTLMDITNGCENVAIFLADGCKTELIDRNFTYVPCNIPSSGFDEKLFGATIDGCTCPVESCASNTNCGCVKYGLNYTSDGLLTDEGLTPSNNIVLQECNSNCTCSEDCLNRVVRKGIKIRMEVFESDGKGLGVKVLETVRKGQFLCEYAGEVLSKAEARKRIDNMKYGDMNFVFIIREYTPSGVLCTYIDPRFKGNVGRFINHACEPNLAVLPVRIETVIPHLCLFALRDISPGEEVTYHYGQFEPDDSSRMYMKKTKPCKVMSL